jgi:L-rhamnose-H+ transport protein
MAPDVASQANPFFGVVLHSIGGLAAASFYIPYKRVRDWSWETYWLVGGFFSWIIAPCVIALLIVPHTIAAIAETDGKTLFWTYLFGVMWGVGGLTFGLAMRYLGIALGYAIALGFCAAFGTLMPPVYSGEIVRILETTSGRIVFLGVTVCLVGIAASGVAGVSKERELSEEQKRASVEEFRFSRGLLVAVFCGVMSACMSYGFAAGKPIAESAVRHGAAPLWQNLPVLIVILLGGFTTNCVWCLALNFKNRTGREYFAVPTARSKKRSLPVNYILCAAAGIAWYLQFFFYSMGTTKMGRYDFSSWTLHMAAIIIFSTFWGIALKEWRGTSARTHVWIGIGLAVLIASTIVVGYGNYLGVMSGGRAKS